MARSGVTIGKLRKIGGEIGISGIDEIRANIAERIDRFTALRIKRVYMRAAFVLVREERDNIHRITGTLQGAIFAAYGDPKKANVLVGTNLRRAPHGGLVAHGHAGPHPAPAHPYVQQAVRSASPTMAAIIAEGLKEIAEK